MSTITHENTKNIQASSSTWWLPLVQGIALVLLGILLLGRPFLTLSVLSQAMGLYFLVTGTVDITNAVLNRTDRSRLWAAVSGIIGLMAGVFVLAAPIMSGVVTTTFLVYFLAASAMVNGVLQMAMGRHAEDGLGREWTWGSFFIGLINLILGLILFSSPLLAEASLLLLTPIWALVGGIGLIVWAFRIRSQS